MWLRWSRFCKLEEAGYFVMVMKTAFQLHSIFLLQGTSSKILVLSDSANESKAVKIVNKTET